MNVTFCVGANEFRLENEKKWNKHEDAKLRGVQRAALKVDYTIHYQIKVENVVNKLKAILRT